METAIKHLHFSASIKFQITGCSSYNRVKFTCSLEDPLRHLTNELIPLCLLVSQPDMFFSGALKW